TGSKECRFCRSAKVRLPAHENDAAGGRSDPRLCDRPGLEGIQRGAPECAQQTRAVLSILSPLSREFLMNLICAAGDGLLGMPTVLQSRRGTGTLRRRPLPTISDPLQQLFVN